MHKLLAITNRNILDTSAGNEKMFGERANAKGAGELRVAWVERTDDKKWKLDLIPEPEDMTPENAPSRIVFNEARDLLRAEKKNCVLYVHGFGKEFKESLEQAWDIAEYYQTYVVLFSWPSQPGGGLSIRKRKEKYKRARKIATQSTYAFERILERLFTFLAEENDEDCDVSFNLLVHSLGNFIIEEFIQDTHIIGQMRVFDNIILNAPDVDIGGHGSWLNKLRLGHRTYVTINESDKVLDTSDIINPDRLGNTLQNFSGNRATYIDLSEGEKVGKTHRHFSSKMAERNHHIAEMFTDLLNGVRWKPQPPYQHDEGLNLYKLCDSK